MPIIEVPLDKIIPNPWQTRVGEPDPEYIRGLAADIQANGLLQAPMGRLVDDEDQTLRNDLVIHNASLPAGMNVQIAFGHNRLAAFRWLRSYSLGGGLSPWGTMPVNIAPIEDEQMAVQAWAENERRRDITPLERALAIKRRMDDFGWGVEEVADHLKISRPVASNALRLLKLPQALQDDLHGGRITERQALALLPLFDQDAEAVEAHGFGDTVEAVVGLARAGESSERLRQKVQEAVDWLKSQVQPSLIETQMPAVPPAPVRGYTAPEEPPPLRPAVAVSPPPPVSQPAGPARPAPVEPARPAAPTTEQLVAAAGAGGAVTWEQSTITLTVTLWPDDGSPEGRAVVVAGRVNESVPMMHMLRQGQVELTGPLAEMLNQLKSKFDGGE